MAKRRWNRRRGDNRVPPADSYAPIQDATEAFSDDLDKDLAIPDFRTELNADDAPDTVDEPFSDMPVFEEALIEDTTPDYIMQSGSHAEGPCIFAFSGATGGVGTTSIATQIAHELAVSMNEKSNRHRPNDPRVCLIDLDFESGACAHHLDLLPSLSIDDLAGPAEQIDSAFTSALVSTHGSGVSLLAAPNTIGANAKVNPQTVMAMLDAAAELYDYVVIDMPRYLQPWSLGVMAAVDVMNVVCELTIPSLHAGRERLTQFGQVAGGVVNAQIILSKYERRSFKNMLKLSDAETALDCKVFATICQDPDTTREALNCGEPAGAVRTDTRFVKDVRKLCGRLQKQAVSPLSQVA